MYRSHLNPHLRWAAPTADAEEHWRSYDEALPLREGSIPTGASTGLALPEAERASARRLSVGARPVFERFAALPRSVRYDPYRDRR